MNLTKIYNSTALVPRFIKFYSPIFKGYFFYFFFLYKGCHYFMIFEINVRNGASSGGGAGVEGGGMGVGGGDGGYLQGKTK